MLAAEKSGADGKALKELESFESRRDGVQIISEIWSIEAVIVYSFATQSSETGEC